MRVPAVVLALIAFGWSLEVRADAIAPLSCPPGLDVRGRHERDCWPRACADDAACGSGAACRSVTRCVLVRQIHEGDSTETVPREIDDGPCTPEGGCLGEGATCRELRRCEPTSPTPAFVEGRWTGVPYEAPAGCAAGPTRSGSGIFVLAFLALAAVARAQRGQRGPPG
jgi:hypothetical protein